MEGQKLLDYQIPLFIKWAGGKSQLLKQFKEFIPEDFERYFEPFVGGGSFAFFIIKNFEPKKIYLSDINEELINCYNIIKNNAEELIYELIKYKNNHSETFYYNIRKLKPEQLSNISRAARFIYLNKTCFNGLYRVNSKGDFNVPIGRYVNPAIFSEDNIREVSNLLKNVDIHTSQFYDAVSKAKEGDFIYFDPPYYPLNKSKSFTAYTKDNFLEKKQIILSKVFKNLDKRGCKVMLSNSDTSFIRELYKGFNQHIVKASRMINCDASKRGIINELVITNY